MFVALVLWAGSIPAATILRLVRLGQVRLGQVRLGRALHGVACRGKEWHCKGSTVVMVAGWFDSTRHNSSQG